VALFTGPPQMMILAVLPCSPPHNASSISRGWVVGASAPCTGSPALDSLGAVPRRRDASRWASIGFLFAGTRFSGMLLRLLDGPEVSSRCHEPIRPVAHRTSSGNCRYPVTSCAPNREPAQGGGERCSSWTHCPSARDRLRGPFPGFGCIFLHDGSRAGS
jgi:hypothetical protein